MTQQICGKCGSIRETGDVCCIAQAKNQGAIHATCSHDPPPMPEEWLIVYLAAQDAEIDRINGVEQSDPPQPS